MSALLGGTLTNAALAAKAVALVKKPAVGKNVVVPRKAGAARTTSKQVVRMSTRSRRRGAPVRRVVQVARQGQPTKERFSEIQQALIDKGYFTGAATGEWGSESVDALKRFQDDQSLKASGRINSLSLIALGLGAKHNPLGTVPVLTVPATGPLAPGTQAGSDGVDEPALVTPASPGLLP